jgi:hypothetical protein
MQKSIINPIYLSDLGFNFFVQNLWAIFTKAKLEGKRFFSWEYSPLPGIKSPKKSKYRNEGISNRQIVLPYTLQSSSFG